MPRLRWGADVPGGPSEARDRLLDAAQQCFGQFGVAKTTVEDVAAEARVSRATIYRYFQNREELLLAVLIREGARFMEGLTRSIAEDADPAEALVETALATIAGVRSNTQLGMLFRPESAGLTMTAPGARAQILRMTAHHLAPVLDLAERQGRLLPGVVPDDAAEFVLRLTLSLLEFDLADRPREGEDLRGFLRRYLVPPLLAPLPSRSG
jgi:AcrR family transcriptional regulator